MSRRPWCLYFLDPQVRSGKTVYAIPAFSGFRKMHFQRLGNVTTVLQFLTTASIWVNSSMDYDPPLDVSPILLPCIFLNACQSDPTLAFQTYCEYGLMVRTPKTLSQSNVPATFDSFIIMHSFIQSSPIFHYSSIFTQLLTFTDYYSFIRSVAHSLSHWFTH